MRKGIWQAAAVAGLGAGLSIWLAQSLAVGEIAELAIGAAGAWTGAKVGERLFLRPDAVDAPKD